MSIKNQKKNNDKNNKNQGKTAWKIISQLTNKIIEHKNISLTYENTTLTDLTLLAENFNKVFIEAPLKITSAIDFRGTKQTNLIWPIAWLVKARGGNRELIKWVSRYRVRAPASALALSKENGCMSTFFYV